MTIPARRAVHASAAEATQSRVFTVSPAPSRARLAGARGLSNVSNQRLLHIHRTAVGIA